MLVNVSLFCSRFAYESIKNNDEIPTEKKNSITGSSLAAPIHWLNTTECLVTLGTQKSQIGQWAERKTFSKLHYLHLIWGLSRYGLTLIFSFVIRPYLFRENWPLPLRPLITNNIIGSKIIKLPTLFFSMFLIYKP